LFSYINVVRNPGLAKGGVPQVFGEVGRDLSAHSCTDLGAPTGIDVEEIRAENDELKKRNADLQKQVDAAIAQIETLKKEHQQ
jgi:hypothetical protein